MGLLHRLSAIPQSAIAHVESAASTSLNARIDAPNSKECNNATARSNRGATAGLHDVAKWTVPNSSVGAPCGCTCSCGYAANAGSVRRTAAAATDIRLAVSYTHLRAHE